MRCKKLPGRYRDLIVACDLEERGRRSVATALGIPEGTLSSRLTAARKMLAERLARRGVAAAGVAMVAVRGPRLAACEVPREVLASAAQLGRCVPGTVPVGVASLASKASRTVTHRALSPVAFLVLAACGAIGATLIAEASVPSTPTAALSNDEGRRADPPQVGPKPELKGPNKLLITRGYKGTDVNWHLVLLDPDGKSEEPLPTRAGKYQPSQAWFSPDGSMLAVLGTDIDTQTLKTSHPLYVRKTADKNEVINLGIDCQLVVWSADGTQLVCIDWPDIRERGTETTMAYTHYLVDVKTKERTLLKLPKNHMVTDWSRDGKYFLTTSTEAAKDGEAVRLHLMNRDGTEHRVLTDRTQLSDLGRFSPDGKQVLYCTVPYPMKDRKIDFNKATFAVLDLDSGKTTNLKHFPLNADVFNLCWSPDGKRMAYTFSNRLEGTQEEINQKTRTTAVVVCDLDGKNQKTVTTSKAKGPVLTIAGLDWR